MKKMIRKEPRARSSSAHQLALRNGAGGGVHKSKPRIEPSIEEYLNEMEEELQESAVEQAALAAENEEIMRDIREIESREFFTIPSQSSDDDFE